MPGRSSADVLKLIVDLIEEEREISDAETIGSDSPRSDSSEGETSDEEFINDESEDELELDEEIVVGTTIEGDPVVIHRGYFHIQ